MAEHVVLKFENQHVDRPIRLHSNTVARGLDWLHYCLAIVGCRTILVLCKQFRVADTMGSHHWMDAESMRWNLTVRNDFVATMARRLHLERLKLLMWAHHEWVVALTSSKILNNRRSRDFVQRMMWSAATMKTMRMVVASMNRKLVLAIDSWNYCCCSIVDSSVDLERSNNLVANKGTRSQETENIVADRSGMVYSMAVNMILTALKANNWIACTE